MRLLVLMGEMANRVISLALSQQLPGRSGSWAEAMSGVRRKTASIMQPLLLSENAVVWGVVTMGVKDTHRAFLFCAMGWSNLSEMGVKYK